MERGEIRKDGIMFRFLHAATDFRIRTLRVRDGHTQLRPPRIAHRKPAALSRCLTAANASAPATSTTNHARPAARIPAPSLCQAFTAMWWCAA